MTDHLPLRARRRPEPAAPMRPAAFVFLLASACLAATGAAEPGVIRIGAVDYVSVDDGADRLGLRVVPLVAQSAMILKDGPRPVARVVPLVAQSAMILKDGPRPVARLADHSREIDLKGLRVFLGDPVIARGGTFYVSRIDYQSHLVPRLRPVLCGPPPRQPRVIAIDPGHGGTDHGAENRALGTMEKTCTLDVSLRLKRLLEGAGYAVVLTRDSDFDLPKAVRSEIANRANADLFVSVHFNSLYPNTKA